MSLKDDALEIKNETEQGANTAERVGGYLENNLNNTPVVGWFDYNNSTVAQSYTTPDSDLILTNDGLGVFTEKTFAPEGVTDIWDASNNEFDWSMLSVGDTWDLRIDCTVNTDSPSQTVDVLVILSYGNLNVEIPFIVDNQIKKQNIDTRLVRYNGGYLKNNTVLSEPAKIIFRSDDTAEVKLNGFYIRLHKKSKETS